MSVCDVLVVGGGPAGAAVAATVARAGASVVIADRPSRRPVRVGEGASPGLEALVGEVFGTHAAGFDPADHLESFGTRSSWGDGHMRDKDYVFHPLGHGWHLDRSRFDRRLRDAAGALGAALGTVEDANPGVVVDATGRQASVARAQGAHRHTFDRLVAVVAEYVTEDDADGSTVVEPKPEGWWYTAVLPESRRIVTFLTDADLVDRSLRWRAGFEAFRRDTVFVDAAINAVNGRMTGAPRMIAADTAACVPIGGPGWLATGDAAASFDPLSSQGIVTAIQLGQHAGRAALAELDGDGADALQSYEFARDEIIAEHLSVRTAHYLDEQRWPDQPFWWRRHRQASVPECRSDPDCALAVR